MVATASVLYLSILCSFLYESDPIATVHVAAVQILLSIERRHGAPPSSGTETMCDQPVLFHQVPCI